MRVCPASSHLNQAYRRFPLFPTKVPTPTPHRVGAFSIDLHTSDAPIVACGCAQIKELFASPRLSSSGSAVVLYAVKRKIDGDAAAPTTDKPATVSKQSMYLTDAAWHPSIPQTPRGIAALLSSLYLFAHSVPQNGAGAEARVLALAYAVLRFPPAIRTCESTPILNFPSRDAYCFVFEQWLVCC